MDGTGKHPRWPMVKLGDVCEIDAGQSPEGKYYNSDGIGLPFYQGKKDFGKKYIQPSTIWTTQITKIAYAGDILMSVRAPVGPINYATEKVCIGRGLASIRPHSIVISDYLFYYLTFIQPRISGREGAVFASIGKSDIASITLPLPPLAEQQRIVARLDAAFAAIDEASAAAASNARNARALFESYLDQVFSQRGAGWVERRLGEVCSYKSGGTPSKQVQTYWNGNIPWVSAKDLKTDEIFDAQLHISEEAVNNSSTTIANRNSILILVRGMGLANGVPLAITRKDVAFNQDIKMLACTDHSITIDFLFIALKYALATTKILSVAGHGTLKIDTDELLSTSVLYPPSDVQATIVNQYSELKHQTTQLTTIYERKVAALAELKQSLLAEVFGA